MTDFTRAVETAEVERRIDTATVKSAARTLHKPTTEAFLLYTVKRSRLPSNSRRRQRERDKPGV